MVSLLVHGILGFIVIAVIVKTNPQIYSRVPTGTQVSALEAFYYLVGVASIALGYYFNNQFVQEYAPAGGLHNFIWGPGSWSEFIMLGYDNPAASSASQDYTIMSVLIFPVWAIVDGRRRGINHPWLFLGFILFGSSASAWAFYLAAVERQRRQQKAARGVESTV
ncbi:DUF2834 domain-containing protein [Mycolicibacterium sp. S2-37]|uniref:DUF2834 domain-containing protein n=1 Tax=Mycolicibacterium sp. S2-37 TaxID=2810297 RepID=UPI001A94E671|nr:DUF2834 domain-containing protein [Mycolicibacterium sp. S2-37]MBO0680181.1 DUF2834 domain-containing protein [Mycolicibacterium sp. S2-37]